MGTWIRSKMPPSLRSTTFILANWQWLGLALLVVIGMVVGHLVTFVTRLMADSVIRRRLAGLAAEQLHPVVRPIGLFVMGVLWWFGLQWLELPVAVYGVLVIAAQFVIALAGVVAVYRAVDVLIALLWERAQQTENRFDDLLVPFLGKALKVVVVVFGLVFIADTLGAPVKTLLAGLGIGGLAFALAAKDTLSNLFGSLTVLLDRPFSVGDWIVTGNVEGTVEVVGFRSTRIRTFYNSQITLPNSNLTNVAVDNMGARQYRRWSTKLTLTYGTSPEKMEAFCEGVRELIRCHPYTRKDYFHVYFNDFGSASLDVLLYVFFDTPDWATSYANATGSASTSRAWRNDSALSSRSQPRLSTDPRDRRGPRGGRWTPSTVVGSTRPGAESARGETAAGGESGWRRAATGYPRGASRHPRTHLWWGSRRTASDQYAVAVVAPAGVLFATELSSLLRERATSNQRQLPGSEAGAHET